MAELGDKLWNDPEFGPPDDESEDPAKLSLYYNGEAPRGYVKPESIHWWRPDLSEAEFMKGGL